jgi:hypothetical protein
VKLPGGAAAAAADGAVEDWVGECGRGGERERWELRDLVSIFFFAWF